MDKRLKISISLIVFILLIAINNICYGKSYTIDDIDMQVKVLEDGSAEVEQTMKYTFNGQFNGIYITIPYELNDLEYNKIREQSDLKDSLYNNSGVTINSVSSNENEFFEKSYAYNGNNGVFTKDISDGLMTIKIYSPSIDESKEFKINYTLQNLCVKHNDVGELYYNFIGGNWDETIKNLNIDVYVNSENKDLKIWSHGNYNGFSQLISNYSANFKTTDVRSGEYFAVRMLFDTSSIPLCTKTSGLDATDLVMKDESIIGQNLESKKQRTKKTAKFCFILLVYWVILLLIYEVDKKYKNITLNEEKLFELYNPLIAGCIQGNREVLSRDIIAVILNLINKKVVNLELRPKLDSSLNETDQYTYLISINEDKKDKMDEIEKYVCDWVFNSEAQVDLNYRLKEIPKEEVANKKFKELNLMAKNELNTLGANQESVPWFVRFLNNILLIVTIIWAFFSVQELAFNIFNSGVQIELMIYMIYILLGVFPLIIAIPYIIISIIVFIRRIIMKRVQKISGKKLVSTTITILIIASIFMIITALFTSLRGLILDELLVTIALIICLTDNLMLKNNVLLNVDASKLNSLRDKIKDYTLTNGRDIEQIFLWNEYLAYGTAFGVASVIMKRMKNMTVDDGLTRLALDKTFDDYIYNDYSYFYRHASLEQRFLNNYKEHMANATEIWLNAAASSGGDGFGGGSSGGGGFSGGGGSGRRRWSLLI